MNFDLKLYEILSTNELQDYERSLNEVNHVSRHVIENDIEILTLRDLRIHEEDLTTSSLSYIFKKQKIYVYSPIKKRGRLLEGSHSDLIDAISQTYSMNSEILSAYSSQVDLLEDYIYEREIPNHFMDLWFDLKKGVLKIERYYSRYISTLTFFINNHKDSVNIEEYGFDLILEKSQFSLSQSSGLISKLDTIHHYYSSIKNDKLNRNIYLLTLLSGIFLPLNLIVGFFGMNTENLIFHGDPSGTKYVIQVLVASFLMMTLGFKLAKTLDSLFLKNLLGKYKFYQTLTSKITKIEKDLDI